MSRRRNRNKHKNAGQINIGGNYFQNNNGPQQEVPNQINIESDSHILNEDTPHSNISNLDNKVNNDKPSKTFGIISIIIGIFMLVFAGIFYFNFVNNSAHTIDNEDSEIEVSENNSSNDSKPNDVDTEGQISSGISTIRDLETLKDDDKSSIKTVSRWAPNDYKEGDILTGKYTVISGDTLWEIAEAAYGDGTQWEQIANANDIGYLSNGNPLIFPGQVLTIPVI